MPTPVEILKFWHSVEFFVPYNLDEVCSKPTAHYKLTETQLLNDGNRKLPWLSVEAFQSAGCTLSQEYEYHYNLYLLPFNKNLLTKISKEVFPIELANTQQYEFEEKLDDEGQTCFAKLPVNPSGQPHFDKLSVSTLPWALGRLSNRDFEALNDQNYQADQKKLQAVLNSLDCHLNSVPSPFITDNIKSKTLSALGIKAILDLLKNWAGFAPGEQFAIVIEHIRKRKPIIKPKQIESRESETQNPAKTDVFHQDKEFKKAVNSQILLLEQSLGLSDPIAASFDAVPSAPDATDEPSASFDPSKNSNAFRKKTEDLTGDPEDPVEDPEDPNENHAASDSIDILNSFYIVDLERIINDITYQKRGSLCDYIAGLDTHKKVDLYKKENNLHIIHKLRPHYLNHGRWPSEEGRFMSLMQQFAINECLHPTNQQSLFSVNGPPGTGKTTLLQEIIADNIVQRARILGTFASASDALQKKILITFQDREASSVRQLDQRLTGFEMVVVSSNNSAVENISRELPLKFKLPKKYQETFSYLKAVASKMFALHKNKQVHPILKEEEKPWGLISAVLGNAKNRKKFREHVFFAPDEKETAKDRVQAEKYLTIWEWKNKYTKNKETTFQKAKIDFAIADQTLRDYLEHIKQLSQIFEEQKNVTQYCKEQYEKLNTLTVKIERLIHQDTDINQMLETIRHNKNQVFNDMDQHLLFRPVLFSIQTLLGTKAAKLYQAQTNKLRLDWNKLLNRERALKNKAYNITSQLKSLQEESECIQTGIHAKEALGKILKQEYTRLSSFLAGIIVPPTDNEISDNALQLQAFWQNEKLNELRTQLFMAALKLHEAWLAEVLDDGSFSGNLIAISKLLNNERLVTPEQALYIWQSLFIWVPVISSTCASIARQFKDLGPETLGWFLIDEAGQAIPQAAVGALWRAKRALIVGDPLQVEPVFTIPPNLIEGLAKHKCKENYEKWLPTLTSAQTLADDANAFGATIDMAGNRQWIGCPLRVHRRCIEPMFTVANQIAYNAKMINARLPIQTSNAYPLGQSRWYTISGSTTDKQYVETQGKFLLNLLVTLYEKEKKLPDLYVITPFKRIKQNLQMLIGDLKNWSSLKTSTSCPIPKDSRLKQWCAKHIGTIHTFQGKEAGAVIIVLGADQNTPGAINWASSRPNLLNVALTRARDRVYIIGDHDLWSQAQYFSTLSKSLLLDDCLLLHDSSAALITN